MDEHVAHAPAAIGRLGWIQFDCADPECLAGFWAAVLGTDMVARLGSPVWIRGSLRPAGWMAWASGFRRQAGGGAR
jgi:hypothetical protein